MNYIKMMYTKKLINRLTELEINLSKKLNADIEFYGGKNGILWVRIQWDYDLADTYCLESCENLIEVAQRIASYEDPREEEPYDWRDYCNY